MSFHVAAEFTQPHQLAFRQHTQFCPRRPKYRRGTSFRENESIVVRILRVLWIKSHVAKEQRGDDVRRRTRRRWVSASCLRGGGDGKNPQLICNRLELFYAFLVHAHLLLAGNVAAKA